jgi:hypothetical protein
VAPTVTFQKELVTNFGCFHMHETHSRIACFIFNKKERKTFCKMGGVEEIKNKSAICSIDCQLCHQEETKKKTFFQIVIVFCFVFQEPQ